MQHLAMPPSLARVSFGDLLGQPQYRICHHSRKHAGRYAHCYNVVVLVRKHLRAYSEIMRQIYVKQ